MTRRLPPAAAGLLVLAACLRAADPPAADPPAAVPLVKTAAAIRVDGLLDEPAWKQAAATVVEWTWGQPGLKAESPRMLVRFTWDDHYLYVGYETFDANLVALPSGEEQGPPSQRLPGASISTPGQKVDVVEFFISFGDEHYFWELHHNAANHFNDVWISVVDEKAPIAQQLPARFGIHFAFGEGLAEDLGGDRKLAMATRLKPRADGRPSTLNDPSDTDTGYTAELRLPWLGLGPPVKSESFVEIERNGQKQRIHGPWKLHGQELRILSVCQNGDLEPIYCHSSPTFPGGWFHKGAAHWPRYLLRDPAAEK